ncbi:GreA/GreB family elongation factor [Alkalimarinus coralli]|uniref:GreA/GreB family elongation factor n=1 Tax=Alkalimarinus coralli TaxID=2935863 RepID=UPI00202B3BDD|nr:GreA/GreB family elongation factor [Alkalimarinus coralli]
MIDKEVIRKLILQQLKADYKNAISSACAAHEAATNEESKAENKYDTRGLEASYLAEGQSRRAAELEQDITAYENLVLVSLSQDSKIRLTATVVLEDEDENQRTVFIGPTSGGMKIVLEDNAHSEGERMPGDRMSCNRISGGCIVVTPKAPLGSALIGKRVGDDIALDAGGCRTHYEIIDIC